MVNKNKISSTEALKTKKGFFIKDPELTSTSVIVPPDGGWGWIVMIASLCCNCIVDGIVFSSGMLQENIAADFNIKKAEVRQNFLRAGDLFVAFVSSLLSGFYLLGGPLVSCLANKVGFRATTIIGALTACIGFGTSYFASSIYFLYFSYGVTGGIIIMCALFGILFRPLDPTIITSETKDDLHTKIIEVKKPHSDKRTAYSMPTSAHNTWIRHSQYTYPKATDIFANAKQTSDLFEMKELHKVEENENIDDDKLKLASKTFRRNTMTDKESRSNYIKNKSAPFNRQDIFFTGSLNRIPQYTSQKSLAYHLSVTNLPEVDKPRKNSSFVSSILDLTLLKSPSFILLALSGFFTMAGFFVPFIYITARAREHMSEVAISLVPVIGLANTIARILCGLLSSSEKINALFLNNIFITLGGLATIISGIYITPFWQFSYAVIFGLAIACFSALRSIIVVDLLGLEKLTNAFGLLMMFQGIAAIIGGPLAGLFMDLTGSYDASFYFAGGLILFSAFLCYPLNYVKKWENKRKLFNINPDN
uniref:CSON014449 protein n=1 Tax=Culicoides sonorensis TaxID=179676 RepID=A0A336MBL5_CULSO